MRLAAISAATFSVLIFDQVLRGRRGPNLWRNQLSSSPLRWPSIQPKQRATSSASACVTVAIPVAFFAIFSHTPGARSCSASIQASNAAALSNGTIGSSSGVAMDGSSLDQRHEADRVEGRAVQLAVALRRALDEHELLAARPDRRDQSPAGGELALERRGDLRPRRRGDVDRVERRLV